MKIPSFLLGFLLLGNIMLGQSKMVIIIKNYKCTLLGYTMDPDGTGNKQSISIIGNLQSASSVLQMDYLSGQSLNPVELFIATPNADNQLITLKDVTVYAIKEALTSYNNGACTISSAGDPVTEIKCKFIGMNIKQGPNVSEPIVSKTAIDEASINNKSVQKWETHPNPELKGISGEVVVQIPNGISYNTHMQFYNAGDTKNRVLSWFGSNKASLLPGLYDIDVDGKYMIRNVPVEQGKQTRLLMGVLQWDAYGGVTLINSDNQKFSYSGPFKILLPAGTYHMEGKKDVPIIIKDGEATQF